MGQLGLGLMEEMKKKNEDGDKKLSNKTEMSLVKI